MRLKVTFPKKIMKLAKGGADLIDIVMSTFLILGILAAVFAAAGTYRHIRNSRLDSIATKVASSDIENIRKLLFAEIPGSATLSPNDYPDITKLPNGSVARTVIPYTPPRMYCMQQYRWQESLTACKLD